MDRDLYERWHASNDVSANCGRCGCFVGSHGDVDLAYPSRTRYHGGPCGLASDPCPKRCQGFQPMYKDGRPFV